MSTRHTRKRTMRARVLALLTGSDLAAASAFLAAPAGAGTAAAGDATRPDGGVPPGARKAGPAPYGGAETPREGSDGAASAPTAQTVAGSCSYETRGDWPHRSGADVSAHGWWIYLSGSCPSQADVTVYLQQYWCDAWGCRWITRAQGAKRVYAGGGSANRANARKYCDSSEYTGWRNVVDVDLVGVSDPSDKAYIIQNVYCRDY